MKLYTWQNKCLSAWEKNNYRGIINVVTGAGKTVFALAAIRRLRSIYPGLCVRIVVPTIPLASQWIQELMKEAPSDELRPGLFGGDRRDRSDRQVMVYIVNSARDHLAAHIRRDMALKKHVLLICDECHHYQSRENRKIFGFFGTETEQNSLYSSIGMSATPFETPDDGFLKKVLGEAVFQYDYDSALRDEVISCFTVCDIEASFSPEELMTYSDLSDKISLLFKRLIMSRPFLKNLKNKDFIREVTRIANESGMNPEEPAAAYLMLTYKRKDLTNRAQARAECVLSLIGRLSASDRIVIFCERVEQAEDLSRMIKRKYGNICAAYHSEINKTARERILGEYRDGGIRILVSCRCLDEGIDVPDTNIGIVMSGTAVRRQKVQRLGRIIRRSGDKESACLYYIYIRQSSEEAVFLSELKYCDRFRLRYYADEDDFSNELYEYAGKKLLYKSKQKGYNVQQMRELRRCLSEGMVRAGKTQITELGRESFEEDDTPELP